MAETNWEIIKTEYITTDISLRRLADKYEVSRTTLTRRCGLEKWVDKRSQYKSKVETKTLEKSANRESGRLAKLMDVTSKAIDVVVNAFDDKEQFNRYIVERKEKYALPDMGEAEEENAKLISERSWSEEQIFKKTDTKALKELTAALKDLTGLMRDFYNIPTPAQAEAQRIAAERLELDRRRADSDNPADTEVIVHFEGEIGDWGN